MIKLGRRILRGGGALIMLLLSAGGVNAQAHFQPGYIVKTPGDTVRGEVDYRRAEYNTRTCVFRSAEGAKEEVFAPDQLTAYRVNDHVYESTITIRQGRQEIKEPLFLEVLARGPVTLFLANKEGDERLLIRSGTGPVQELTQEVRTIQLRDSRRQQIIPLYRGVLAEAFSACPAERLRATEAELKLSSILAAVNRYNSCVTGKTALAPPRRTNLRLHAFGGALVHERLVIGQGNGTNELNDVLRGRAVPVVGLALGLTPNRTNARLTYTFGASFSFKHHFTRSDAHYRDYEDLAIGRYPGRGKVELSFSSIDLYLMPRYRFRYSGLMPFVEAGPTYWHIVGLNKNRFHFQYDADWLKPFDRKLFEDPKSQGIGLLFGTGVEYGRSWVSVRYQLGYQISPFGAGSLGGCLSILAAYALKK